MTDCEHPKCHEAIRLCLKDKVSKKAMWTAIIVIGFPLLITGVKVWSQQEGDKLRYSTKEEAAKFRERQSEIAETVRSINKDIDEIKKSQEENRRDVKEILRFLRDQNHVGR